MTNILYSATPTKMITLVFKKNGNIVYAIEKPIEDLSMKTYKRIGYDTIELVETNDENFVENIMSEVNIDRHPDIILDKELISYKKIRELITKYNIENEYQTNNKTTSHMYEYEFCKQNNINDYEIFNCRRYVNIYDVIDSFEMRHDINLREELLSDLF